MSDDFHWYPSATKRGHAEAEHQEAIRRLQSDLDAARTSYRELKAEKAQLEMAYADLCGRCQGLEEWLAEERLESRVHGWVAVAGWLAAIGALLVGVVW